MTGRRRARTGGDALVVELGGHAGVSATVDSLYRRLVGDPMVAPYFEGVDLDRVRSHMTDFLVVVLDGPDRYHGRTLVAAHAQLGITDDAFDSTASHLLDALEERAVRPEVLDLVLDRVAPLRSSVVSRE
jgi:hemoglobin